MHDAGPQTTVQDLGRRGSLRVGIPPSGPMDHEAFLLANRPVDNADDAARLECSITGPRIEFADACWVAVTGADMPVDTERGSHAARGMLLTTVSRTAIRCILSVEFKCGRWPMRNPLRLVKGFLLPPVDAAQLRGAIAGPCLIVVSRARRDVLKHLQHQFARDERVEVVLDRRSGWGRRRAHERPGVERRRGDRRQLPSVENDLTLRDFVIIPRQGTGVVTRTTNA
jgi:hypothetical protein